MDIKIVIEFSSEANSVIPGNMATLQGSQLIFSCLSAVSPLPLALWILSFHLFYFPRCIRSPVLGEFARGTKPNLDFFCWNCASATLKSEKQRIFENESVFKVCHHPQAKRDACRLLWLMTCIYLHRFNCDIIRLFTKGPFDLNVL